LRYLWNWGDGTAVSTTPSGSHVFPVAGTYTVTLTVTDTWGRAGTPVTRQVTTSSEPAGNAGPSITFPQPACTGLSCAVTSTGTSDPEGIRSYSWSWGDGTAPSTGASPSAHVYAAAGTYTIIVTVLDNWGRPSTATRQVTVA
jgi:PKD repeat protein